MMWLGHPGVHWGSQEKILAFCTSAGLQSISIFQVQSYTVWIFAMQLWDKKKKKNKKYIFLAAFCSSMFHSFFPRLRLFLFPLLSKLFCFLFIIRPPHDNVSSSSSDLFVYSSEKAVKEGTLHVDHIKVYSPKKRQSNFILIFRKVPSHNYHN